MIPELRLAPTRVRLLSTRALSRLGFREDSFLIVLAVLIGLVTAAAAVAFHEVIDITRNLLYEQFGEKLYGRWMVMLIVWPALGGLAVGVISRFVFRAREGHGIVDVMESVIRSSGFIRPWVAIEKIITSGITIGTGGSAGAEGPIVQIGAAISSGIGQVFRVSRQQMGILIGCGSAAGISAIFNAPMGGLLFTLEVILQDFSITNMTPVVVASVIANVATKAIFRKLLHRPSNAIFSLGYDRTPFDLDWLQVQNFIILGLICGIIGVVTTKLMYYVEKRFHKLSAPPFARPAIGGALLGVVGIAYVLIFGWAFNHPKPVSFDIYPAPVFYGDGYGFIQKLLQGDFYQHVHLGFWFTLLAFLVVAKLVGTCLTLGSGGSGGIIAPSLFLGATAGGAMGIMMKMVGLFDVGRAYPEAYAIVGMGAVLAAIVHSPLASIVIVLELTSNPTLVLPAMLAVVVATGIARLIYRDSIYTAVLRLRGIRAGAPGDTTVLHRLTVEQVSLEPVSAVTTTTPLQELLDRTEETGVSDFVVVNQLGRYAGMVVADDLRTALFQREAVPLLVAGEIVRPDLPAVRSTDDLASVLDTFAQYEVARLPVSLATSPDRIIGLISRRALMQRYHLALSGK